MKDTYSDILFSVPTYDDDNDSWYQESIWFHGTGKRRGYTICDSDGNHEPISKRDVGQLEKQSAQLWRNYSKWVIEHGGEDPIGEFMVKRERKFKRNYVGYFLHWIGEEQHGLALRSVRWAKGVQDPQDLPKGFQEYLCLHKVGGRWCMKEVTVDILKSEVGYVGKDYFKGTAEWKEPLPEKAIRNAVLRAARKHLSRE